MSAEELFQEACQKLAATPSLNKKFGILSAYKDNAEVMERFRRAIDPNCTDPRLNVGIGAATINKLIPNLVKPFQMMLAEQINFGPSETWQTMVHHLDDAKNWVVCPDPIGIHCLLDYSNRQVTQRNLTKLSLGHHLKGIERELQTVFGSDSVLLDGRLVCKGQSLSQMYEIFSNPEPIEETLEQQIQFVVLDYVVELTTTFENRYAYLQDKFTSLSLSTLLDHPLGHLFLAKYEPVIYNSSEQQKRFKAENFSKCLFRYTKATYIAGKSRNVLSLRF